MPLGVALGEAEGLPEAYTATRFQMEGEMAEKESQETVFQFLARENITLERIVEGGKPYIILAILEGEENGGKLLSLCNLDDTDSARVLFVFLLSRLEEDALLDVLEAVRKQKITELLQQIALELALHQEPN